IDWCAPPLMFCRHEKAVFGSHVHTNLAEHSVEESNGTSLNWAFRGVPGSGVFSSAFGKLSSFRSAQVHAEEPLSHGAFLRIQPFCTRLTTFALPPLAAPG